MKIYEWFDKNGKRRFLYIDTGNPEPAGADGFLTKDLERFQTSDGKVFFVREPIENIPSE